MSVTLDGVSTLTSLESATATAGASELDQESFMNLLVTQLQNQDPLNPQSNEEFVAQLAQFSSLEQLVSLNSGVNAVYLASASINNATMTQLLGNEVVAWSSEFNYDGSGAAELHFDSESDAASATMTISDADGNVVWSGEMGALEDGEGSWTWDGTDANGNSVDAGVYSFDIDAANDNGDDVVVSGQLHGTVDGMSYEDGNPVPSVGDVDFELGEILRVSTPQSDQED
jgi:flagellar basal-body rod modification protein FlgD